MARPFTIDTTPPLAPVLSLPADGATPIGIPTFSWLASVGANAYEFEIATSSGFGGDVINTSPVQAVTSYRWASLPVGTGTLYYWHVRARDAAQNWSAWSAYRTVNPQTTVPVAPVQVAPAASALTNDTTPTFSWNSVANGHHYQIQVSVLATFTSTSLDETLGEGVLTFTPSIPLSPDGLKYWRVRAWNAFGGVGAWSAARPFTLDTTPPAAPVLSLPADGASVVGTPTFSWLAAVGANAYQFEIATSSGFDPADVVNTSPVQAVTSYKPGGTLPLLQPLYWHAKARDAAGNWGSWSTYRTVTILPPIPVAPLQTAPAASAMLNDNTPTLTWNSVAYGATYQVQVAAISTFTTVLQDATGADLTYTASTLADGLYYWRVRAYNITPAPGAWSVARPFTIDTTPPPAPVLSTPANGSIYRSNPTFTWLAAAGANAYQFQFASDSGFTMVEYTSAVLAVTSHTPNPAMTVGAHYWRVRSRDAAGNWSTDPGGAGWSASRLVEVRMPLPLAPVLTSPASGSMQYTKTPTFTWNSATYADSYNIQVATSYTFASPQVDVNLPSGQLNYTPSSDLVPDGLRYWRVRGINIHGEPGTWSAARTFTINTSKQWTFMVYLAADNNLEAAAVDDFIEMATAGSSSGVNIVVQFDRSPGYDTRYDDWTGTKRYYITSGMTPTSANALSDLGELNMGDPNNLQDFVSWAKSNYPAYKYALVLWNHGGGFQPMADGDLQKDVVQGVAWDDTDSSDYLSNPEISTVLAAVTTNGANKLELVGFDACLMAQLEVYQHVKAYTKAAAGSEEIEPGAGWPYHTILADLNANPGWTGVNLANAIVNHYNASYGENDPGYTQSAVQFGTAYDSVVASYFANFVQAMRTNLDANRTFIANALAASQSFSVPDYIDLSDFALQLYNRTSNAAIRSAASALITALNGVITNNKAGSSWPNARGISIFFPKDQSTWGTWAATYQANQWLARDTSWNEFINEYYYTNMTITLTWGEYPYDLDSHLWLPVATPYHILWSDKGNTDMTAFPYAYLDVDDTYSYGPENISVKQFVSGTYYYSVYDWTGDTNYPLKTSGATVRVYRNGVLVKTYYASTASGSSSNRWWNVFAYTNGVFSDYNSLASAPLALYDISPSQLGAVKK